MLRRPTDSNNSTSNDTETTALLAKSFNKQSLLKRREKDLIGRLTAYVQKNYPAEVYKWYAFFPYMALAIEPLYSFYLGETTIMMANRYLARSGMTGVLLGVSSTGATVILSVCAALNLGTDVFTINPAEETEEYITTGEDSLDKNLREAGAGPFVKYLTKGAVRLVIGGSQFIYVAGAAVDLIPIVEAAPSGPLKVVALIGGSALVLVPAVFYYNMFSNNNIKTASFRMVEYLMRERFKLPSSDAALDQYVARPAVGILNVFINLVYMATGVVISPMAAAEVLQEALLAASYRGGVFAFAGQQVAVRAVGRDEHDPAIPKVMLMLFAIGFINVLLARGLAPLDKYFGKKPTDLDIAQRLHNIAKEIEADQSKIDLTDRIAATDLEEARELGAYDMTQLWYPQAVFVNVRKNLLNRRLANNYGQTTVGDDVLACVTALARSLPLAYLLTNVVEMNFFPVLAVGATLGLQAYYANYNNALIREAMKNINSHYQSKKEAQSGTSKPAEEQKSASGTAAQPAVAVLALNQGTKPHNYTGADEDNDAEELDLEAQDNGLWSLDLEEKYDISDYIAAGFIVGSEEIQTLFKEIEAFCKDTPGLDLLIMLMVLGAQLARFVLFIEFIATSCDLLIEHELVGEDELEMLKKIQFSFFDQFCVAVTLSFPTFRNQFINFQSFVKEVLPYQMAKTRVSVELPDGQESENALPRRNPCDYVKHFAGSFFPPVALLPEDQVRKAHARMKEDKIQRDAIAELKEIRSAGQGKAAKTSGTLFAGSGDRANKPKAPAVPVQPAAVNGF